MFWPCFGGRHKLACRKAVPENTKKSTSYAVNVFDGKLLVNVSFNCQHK